MNGWLRLWIIASLAWAGVVTFYTWQALIIVPLGTEADLIRSAALFWGVTSVAGLVLGYGVAWAVRGFQPRSDVRKEKV